MLADDGRQWWVCGATVWEALYLVEAPNKRAALAGYRRIITNAERANGTTQREARDMIAAAGLTVFDDPLTTPEAFNLELVQALGYAATRWSGGREVIVPSVGNPAAVSAAITLLTTELGADKAARIRAQVLARYLPDADPSSSPRKDG